MSKYLDEIERHTVERIGSGDSIDKQFWYLFSYCKGLEYMLEGFGKLGESVIDKISKEGKI